MVDILKARSSLPPSISVVVGVGLFLLCLSPQRLVAQVAPPPEGDEEVVAEPIEWNFERVPVTTPATDVSLQERWAAPFAVVSQGTPRAREPRSVVVLGDSAAARRAAAEQSESGESVAEVTVEESSSPRPAPAASAADAGPAGSESSPPPPRASAAQPSAAEGEGRTHRVAYGETWYGLAREYRVSSGALAAANPDVDPERLRSGMVLRIPAGGAEESRRRTHTVARGDTLFGIARRYGVSPAAIRDANRMTDEVVRLGQTLVIPQEEVSR